MSLLLLHGYSGDPGSWDAVVERLPAGATVLRPALFGHHPRLLEATGGFFGEVDRIAAWLRAEGRSGLHLAGYSLGARIGLGLLVRHGDLFARATLIGLNPGLGDEGARRERCLADERWATLIEREGVARFVLEWLAQPLFASQERLPWELRAVARARRLRHGPAGLAAAMRALGLGGMPDLAPSLPAIRIPVRLLAGAEDPKFVALATRLAAALPHARAQVIPGAGHDLTLERPDAVAAALSSEETP